MCVCIYVYTYIFLEKVKAILLKSHLATIQHVERARCRTCSTAKNMLRDLAIQHVEGACCTTCRESLLYTS